MAGGRIGRAGRLGVNVSAGKPIQVAISGACGRLGARSVALLAPEPDIRLSGLLTSPGGAGAGFPHPDLPSLVVTDRPEEAFRGARVIVEMSLPGQLMEHAELAASAGAALLVAVTGLSPEQDAHLAELSKQVPVLVTANLSVGISALAHLCREAARGLGYQVEIVESHHSAKRDAPSGTALMLARAIADIRGWGEDVFRIGRSGSSGPRPEREIGIHSLRGGDVVGEHRVIFEGPGEQLVLSHSARSRDCFARGVAPAARFLAARGPGRYTMDDVWKASLNG